jgi:hypothetical protein
MLPARLGTHWSLQKRLQPEKERDGRDWKRNGHGVGRAVTVWLLQEGAHLAGFVIDSSPAVLPHWVGQLGGEILLSAGSPIQ